MTTTQEIAQRFETLYRGEPWYGESLKTKLATLTDETAYQQPVAGKHSVAEILSHMEYWRHRFVLELQGKNVPDFSEGENWPDLNGLRQQGWKKMQTSFEVTHDLLVSLLKQNEKPLSSELLNNLGGLVDHDIYHQGQIGLVKSIILK